MNKKFIAEILKDFQLINADVIEPEQSAKISEQIKKLQMVEVDHDGLVNLMYTKVYDWFLTDGRDQSLEQIEKLFGYMNLGVDKELIKEAYDIAGDLYDDNEADGFNDRQYPWRKRTSEDLTMREYYGNDL